MALSILEMAVEDPDCDESDKISLGLTFEELLDVIPFTVTSSM